MLVVIVEVTDAMVADVAVVVSVDVDVVEPLVVIVEVPDDVVVEVLVELTAEGPVVAMVTPRSEEHTSELQSP